MVAGGIFLNSARNNKKIEPLRKEGCCQTTRKNIIPNSIPMRYTLIAGDSTELNNLLLDVHSPEIQGYAPFTAIIRWGGRHIRIRTLSPFNKQLRRVKRGKDTPTTRKALSPGVVGKRGLSNYEAKDSSHL